MYKKISPILQVRENNKVCMDTSTLSLSLFLDFNSRKILLAILNLIVKRG